MADLLALEYLLRRDRLIVAVGLAAVVALAWVYLATGAGMATSMADMPMDMPMPWSPFYAALAFVMWWAMMIAMVVPSAAPSVLLFTTTGCRQEASVRPSGDAVSVLGRYRRV